MSDVAARTGGSFFQRYLLPSFALKGVIIGGGYATGRELAEYFLSQGPRGALAAMVLATVIWSAVAATSFALAHMYRTYDYRSFVSKLLGRASIIFEVCFVLFSVLLLAVFGAAAGEVGASLFDVPALVGTVVLALLIAGIAGVGEGAVEAMFKYVSTFLYAIYTIFLVLSLSRFGERIEHGLGMAGADAAWPLAGLTYGTYNIVAAVMILPVLRHMTSRRNAVVAGLVAGPMAMLPAFAFLLAMIGFYPDILSATLPSDYILQRLESPAFRFAFQTMVFGALLESGVGVIHAINERAVAWRESREGAGQVSSAFRPVLTLTILVVCMFVANQIGLVDLIASGYRIMAFVFILSFVVPLMTIGLYRLVKGTAHPEHDHA